MGAAAMIMQWKVTEQPSVEPVSLNDAKAYLRIQTNTEDSLVSQIIAAARSYCEEELDLAIMEQEITATMDTWPDGRTVHLPRSNLLSVTSVTYTDGNGDSQPFTDFTTDIYRTPGRIINNTTDWPELTDDANAVTIVYRAGFEESDFDGLLVPPAVTQAMWMLITHFYENRSAAVIGVSSDEVGLGVDRLLQKFRRMGI